MEDNQGATAEVIEAVEEKSMDDTIRETLRGLQEPESEPVAREEDGKFKAEKPAEETKPEEIPVDPEPVVKAAPNTWKKEVAEKWSTLPPDVQSEVERREADFHKGIAQYKEAATFGQSIDRAISPYMDTLRQLNVAPEVAISSLMEADRQLRYGSPDQKAAYFASLAQSYGIDLGQVQNAPTVDPVVQQLQDQVRQLQGKYQEQTLMGQREAEASLNSEIEAFKADPKHSHFESVRGHMSALLQAGQAKDLADAYEQAVYANPVTRQAMLQQQAEAQAKEATQKAKAAKEAASVNVRSRPAMAVSKPIGTMDDTIRDTFRKLTGAAS